MNVPLIILGGGGHAKVLIEALTAQHHLLLGFTDPDETRTVVLGVRRLGDDSLVWQFRSELVRLVNGLGSVGSTSPRRKLYDQFTQKGYVFENTFHPSAILGSDVQFGSGVQIMAGVVVQPGCRIGANTIINTRASVDHDCTIEAHVHIGPGAVLSGGVRVEEGVHIGPGATIIHGITIGAGSVVGAGAVVVKDVPAHVTVAGVPAKDIQTHATK